MRLATDAFAGAGSAAAPPGRRREAMRSTRSLVVLISLCASTSAAEPEWRPVTPTGMWGRIDGLHFVNSTTGWIGSGGGFIQHTADGGATWTQQYYDPDLYFR